MPASTTVDDKVGIVFVRAWGVLLMEELVEAQKRIAEAPNFQPHFRELLDFADVQESRLTPAGLQQMAATTPFKRNVPRAIVAKSEVLSAFFRMYGVFSGNDRLRWGIFQRLEDARAWLDAVSSST